MVPQTLHHLELQVDHDIQNCLQHTHQIHSIISNIIQSVCSIHYIIQNIIQTVRSIQYRPLLLYSQYAQYYRGLQEGGGLWSFLSEPAPLRDFHLKSFPKCTKICWTNTQLTTNNVSNATPHQTVHAAIKAICQPSKSWYIWLLRHYVFPQPLYYSKTSENVVTRSICSRKGLKLRSLRGLPVHSTHNKLLPESIQLRKVLEVSSINCIHTSRLTITTEQAIYCVSVTNHIKVYTGGNT